MIFLVFPYLDKIISYILGISIFPFTMCGPYSQLFHNVRSTYYENDDAYIQFMKYLILCKS